MGRAFAHQILGTYERLSHVPDELVLGESKYVLFDDPLGTKVRLKGGGAVYAAGGVREGGEVVVESYGGVAVRGEMAGRLAAKSYSYFHVDGDLTGTADVDSYATLVLRGDLVGTLHVRSYAKVLLRGRIRGKIDPSGACWSTFYFQGYWSRAELERLGAGFGQVTLHVERSDLAPGKHQNVGSWQDVIVGDPVWERLAR